jgi:hypothetical protein
LNLFAILSLLSVIYVIGSMTYQHIQQTFFWNDIYSQGVIFGEDCEYGIEPSTEGNTFEKVNQQDFSWVQLKMPYRDAAFEDRPSVPVGGYLVTRCEIPIPPDDPARFGWAYLGRSYGTSAIYLNQRNILEQADNGRVDIPISPKEKEGALELKIISKRDNDGVAPGLSSLAPLVYSSERKVFEDIRRNFGFFRVEAPTFRIAAVSAMLLVFGTAWLLGIRYPDVIWMIVCIACITLAEFCNFHPSGPFPRSQRIAELIFVFASSLAFPIFMAAFLRLPLKKLRLDLWFVGGVGVYSALVILLPDTTLRALQLFGSLPSVVAGVLSFVVFYLALGSKPEFSTKRRVWHYNLFRYTVALAGVLFILDAELGRSTGVEIAHFLRVGLVMLFAGFVSSDLVVFHGEFFQEKSRRLEEEKRTSQYVKRLELGKSVQEILFPAETKGQIGPNNYRYHHEASEFMSGDWVYVWKTKDQVHLLMGDVVGKGPSAAIAVAAILCILDEAQAANSPIKDTLAEIDLRLNRLFKGYMTTTLSAITLRTDRTVTCWGCGSPDLIHLSGHQAALIPMPGNALGGGSKHSPCQIELSLKKGDALILHTDGVADGPKDQQDLLNELLLIKDHWNSDASIVSHLAAWRPAPKIKDDKTLIVAHFA